MVTLCVVFHKLNKQTKLLFKWTKKKKKYLEYSLWKLLRLIIKKLQLSLLKTLRSMIIRRKLKNSFEARLISCYRDRARLLWKSVYSSLSLHSSKQLSQCFFSHFTIKHFVRHGPQIVDYSFFSEHQKSDYS